jgi:hypothetical protein
MTDSSSWNAAVNDALANHPKILNSPGLAVDAINSSDPNQSAGLLMHTATTQAAQQGAQDYLADNGVAHHWWDGALHSVANAAGWMAKPLQEIQKDYKYIHSLYTRHGVVTGTIGALAVVGGGAAGFAFGPIGAALGADLAAAGFRHMTGHLDQYKDSYNDSNDENYKVSFGRDTANALGANGETDSGWGKFVSGALDSTFDIVMDPLMKIGAARTAVRTGKWVAAETEKRYIPIAFRSEGAKQFLARNSIVMHGNVDALNKLYQAIDNPTAADRLAGTAARYGRALDELGSKDFTAADVLYKYPELRGIVDELGAATSREEAHKVFEATMFGGELTERFANGGIPMLPSRTVLRSSLSKVSDKLKQFGSDDLDYSRGNAANFIVPKRSITEDGTKQWIMPAAFRPFNSDVRATAISNKVRTFSGYRAMWRSDDLMEINTKEFDPKSMGAADVIMKMAYYAMGHKEALKATNEWLSMKTLSGEPDLARRRDFFLSLNVEILKKAGFPNDPEALQQVMEHMGMKLTPSVGHSDYGWGILDGDAVSKVKINGGVANTALYEDQAGRWAMMDFAKLKKAMQSMNSAGQVYGNIDEFVSKNWTDSIFKPFALLTGGFGLRVATNELIGTMIRFGSLDTIKGKLSVSASRIKMDLAKETVQKAAKDFGYELSPNEEEYILAHSVQAISGGATDYIGDTVAQQLWKRYSDAAITAGSDKAFLNDLAKQAEGHKLKKAIGTGLDKIANEYDLTLAAEIAMFTHGHMAPGATLNSHGIDNDPVLAMRHNVDITSKHLTTRKMKSDAFRVWNSGEDHFKVFMLSNLQKMSQRKAGQAMANDFLKMIPEGKTTISEDEIRTLVDKMAIPEGRRIAGTTGRKDIYATEREIVGRYKTQSPEDASNARVQDFLNLIIGADGTIHRNLAEHISLGVKPLASDITSIASKSLPAKVIGNDIVPMTAADVGQRIAQSGFKKVLDPIIAHMSRDVLFHQNFKLAMRNYRPMMEAGTISHQTGVRLAATAATDAMIPMIHNPALRTQFAIMARNYLPFYFAQEQATKRYIKLVADNPQALRAYQLIEHGVSDPGFVQTDDQGNRFLVIPGIGEISAGLITGAAKLGIPVVGGLPVSVKGNMESLKTVLPEMNMPGVSPFVSVAGNALVGLDPALGKFVKPVIGDIAYGQKPLDALIPSAPARSWFKALSADERDRAFSNAMLTAIASANYHGQLPPATASPAEQQAFIDRIKNNARSVLMIKGLLALVSPLAPQVSQEDTGLRDEFYKLVKEKGDWPTALHEFLKVHGDGAISYTVARSEGTIPGATMPYTTEGINWIQSNEKLINSDLATGAVFLIPQGATSGDAQLIHDELIKMHLRQARTPKEFLTAVYVAAGNNSYYADKAVHDERIKGLTGSALDAENANWTAYKDQFGKLNPLWHDEFISTARVNMANRAYDNLSQMFADGTAPAGKQTELVKGLFADYQGHLANRASLKNSVFASGTLTQEDDRWQAYLDQVVKEQPLLTTVVNGIFRRLS